MADIMEYLKKAKDLLEYEISFGGTSITLMGVIQIILILIIFFVISRILRRIIKRRLLSHLAEGVQFVILKMIHYGLMIFGFLLAINIVGIQMTSLTVIFGLLGVGFAFGLQNITSNFVSGIILLFERPVSVGDYIEVANVVGRIVSINMRSTTVVTDDNITLIVPNSRFIEGTVTNWLVGDPKIRFAIPIGVAYGSNMDLVRKTLLELANNHPSILKEPEPDVIFKEFAESSLNFELRVWLPSPLGRIVIMSDLNYAIDKAFRENNINIPFKQVDVHITNKEQS